MGCPSKQILAHTAGVSERDPPAGASDAAPRRDAVRDTECVDAESAPDFGPFSERFVVRRRLGVGGFGAVYEVLDRARGAVVALKMMARRDHRDLYQFKREFRSLAELSHPNLAQLYELHSDGDRWFFTMELVDGQDALSYVRKNVDPAAIDHQGRVDETAPTVLVTHADVKTQAPAPPEAVHAEARSPAMFDEARLRLLVEQLADGLCFLHGAGWIHRDLKPSNVKVARDGRAVMLDFGLVAEVAADNDRSADAISGTPAYMAPEQAAGEPVGPAADWYAVGVMLYEALTGRRPFVGTATELLRQKRETDPRPPSELAEGVPADLNALCVELLRRTPSRRPTGEEVRARITGGALVRPVSDRAAIDRDRAFVGRTAQQRRLREAFGAARAGRTVAALVHGASGMGKSALLAHFLSELRSGEADLVLLSGRCFEQESVPYKALDSVIDELARYLQRLPRPELGPVLPRDFATLARVFPVLQGVTGMDDAPRRAVSSDKVELRRRAFAALRELCARIGDRRTLVICIDDLQWGDADSGALLADLLSPPDPPALLLLAAYRSEDTDRSECLRELLPRLRAAGSAIEVADVPVERLSDDEANALAAATLGEGDPGSERAATIARESGGLPFFLDELARHATARGRVETVDAPPLSIKAMIDARVAALPAQARRLLEVIAVAGRPIERAVAARAAAVGDEEPSIVGLLRRERLLRAIGDGHSDRIEPYHDRIRETVIVHLDPEATRGHHARLAPALEATGRADLETLAVHFLGAGDAVRAAAYMHQAADAALEALGFDRAARLYRQALALGGEDEETRRTMEARLGDALASSGHSADAAGAYVRAAQGAPADEALVLRRSAAERYLVSGGIEEGMAVMRSVLDATGMSMPTRALGTLARMLPLLAQLWWRGLRFRERPASELGARERLHIDACAALAASLPTIDPLSGMYFQKRFLLLALRSGEPHRILRALNYEAHLSAVRGRDTPTRYEDRVAHAAVALVERLGDRGVQFQGARGMILALRNQFRDARVALECAAARLREDGSAALNERGLCHFYLIQSLYCLGEWKELVARQAVFVDDARAHGDRLAEARLTSLTGHIPALINDLPEEAREAAVNAEGLWSHGDLFQHFPRVVARGSTELYRDEGVGERALALIEARWPALVRSHLMMVSTGVRTQCLALRGSALVAAACAVPTRRASLLRRLDRDARTLARLGTRAGRAFSLSLHAGAAIVRGDREGALAHVADAEQAFASLDMALHAAACRRRRGELRGGDGGRALVEEADAVMRLQGILRPTRLASMLVPGVW